MASRAEKIAISLDPEILARVEKVRKATGESRSALVSRALRQLLQAEARALRVAEYVEAYRRAPETGREVEEARRRARRSVADVPWDDS